MKKFMLSIVITLAVLHFNCKKGDTGPAGPPGPAGPQGPGATYSPWIVTGSDWDTTLGTPYGAVAVFDKAAPGITQSIIDSGMVLAYMKGDPTTGLTDEVFPLPYSVGGASFGFTDLWDFVLNTPGNIRFLYKSDLPWTAAELGVISFRYIIVPGSTPGGRMLNLRKITYKQVCEAFGIPE